MADVKGLRPFSTSVKSALHVHESHVPLFGKGPGEICSGAKLMRHGRVTVGVPCGSTEISSESGFCLHCERLFLAGFDKDGFVALDESTMQETFELYEPGKPGVLWNSPPIVHVEDLFSSQVQVVKDLLHDTDFELERD